MTTKYYAGIGSRDTPKEICELMTLIASVLEEKEFILRSGGATGADSAFELGVKNNNKQIFLPWQRFNNNESPLYQVGPKALEIAQKYHPNWNALSNSGKLLMGRNSYQVLGYYITDETVYSSFIVCWTKNGLADGGTGQAIRIATDYNIPIYNLYYEKYRDIEFYKHLT